MPILISTKQAQGLLADLIQQGKELGRNPEPVPYYAWKMLVHSSIGLIYGTLSPETREIEDGFLLGENSAPPLPNIVEARNRVIAILEIYASTLGLI